MLHIQLITTIITFITIIIVIGDWGLGIGDWAQSPIPNPQSPKIFILTYKQLNLIKLNLIVNRIY